MCASSSARRGGSAWRASSSASAHWARVDAVGGLAAGGNSRPVILGPPRPLDPTVACSRTSATTVSAASIDGWSSTAEMSASRCSTTSASSTSSVISRCTSSTTCSARCASSHWSAVVVPVRGRCRRRRVRRGRVVRRRGWRRCGVPTGADLIGAFELGGPLAEHVGGCAHRRVSTRDRLAQRLFRVVASDLALPQHARQADGVAGESGPLRGSERVVVDELVEHSRGAAHAGSFGDVGEAFGDRAQRLGFGLVMFGFDDGGEVEFGALARPSAQRFWPSVS